jgi:protoporphyrinogen oxidase
MNVTGRGRERVAVLGGGVTGIAAGRASGGTVFEADTTAGGICASYYMFPGDPQPYFSRPKTPGWYRFEKGGGHWIFGGDPAVLRLFERAADLKRYARRSSVRLDDGRLIPFPLQDHLHELDPTLTASILSEAATAGSGGQTMAESHQRRFGNTLFELFFRPFHERYTAGLYGKIAPQDDYKTPVDVKRMIRGALNQAEAVGYNTTFLYPTDGLDALVAKLAEGVPIEYAKRCVTVDLKARELHFDDGSGARYDSLISTLPLPLVLAQAGLETEAPPDPYTGVVVLNIGAVRGDRCPDDHWIYVTRSNGMFHRVGFYTNVDGHFAPADDARRRVGLYVERAFPGGTRLTPAEIDQYRQTTIAELQDWGIISDVEVCDVSTVDVAYTWQWKDSAWRGEALKLLDQQGVLPVGRYARWVFQGIADSVRDGLMAGATLA